MQENVRFRKAAKVIAWFHFVFAILGFIVSIITIGFISYILAVPSFVETLDPKLKEQLAAAMFLSVFGLIYYIVGLFVVCVDIYVARGLIRATHMLTSISDSLPLAKRWMLWFAIVTVAYAVLALIFSPIKTAILSIVVSFIIRGILCYLVHRYILSMEEAETNIIGFVSEKA